MTASKIEAKVRLIRFLAFDGSNLTFVGNETPTAQEVLSLAAAYHGLAAQLQRYQLCKASIHTDIILVLEVMKTIGDKTT